MSVIKNSPKSGTKLGYDGVVDPALAAASKKAAAANVADKAKPAGTTPPAIAQTSIPQKWPVDSKKKTGQQ